MWSWNKDFGVVSQADCGAGNPVPPYPHLTASLQAFNNSALKRKKMDVYTTCSRSDSIVTQRTLLRIVMGFCTFFCFSIEMLPLNAPFLRLIL